LGKLIAVMRHRMLLAPAIGLICAATVVACTTPTREQPGAFPALDAAAQARRYAAMQNAFENNASGQIAYWDENSHVRGRVVPIATLRTSLYGWCREYEERIATYTDNHRLVGIACRTENGQWLVVDIRSYVEAAPQKI
jgi:hypothetical protein